METENKVYENTVLPENIKHFESLNTYEPSEYEIEMNKNFITPSKLLELEEEEKKNIKTLTPEEEELRKRRDYITKVKVVALDKMEKHPLCNPSIFSVREKKKLISIMEDLLKLKEEELICLFNDVCNEVLFSSNSDYSVFPVYNN